MDIHLVNQDEISLIYAIENGNLNLCNKILLQLQQQHGGDDENKELTSRLNEIDKFGNTPLLLCVKKNWISLVYILLNKFSKKIDINHENHKKENALICACFQKNESLALFLIALGIFLILAAYAYHIFKKPHLIQKDEINTMLMLISQMKK